MNPKRGSQSVGSKRCDAPRSIWLVGNAPTMIDRSVEIDRADLVVRFNNAFGFGDVTGTHTTHLFLINCGGQMREWLDDDRFCERAPVARAETIVLPIDPGKDDLISPPLTQAERLDPAGRNYRSEAVARFTASGKTVFCLPISFFVSASRTIGYERPERAMQAPSTGLIALKWALARFDARIDVTGFGFDGWSGHRWDRERAFFYAMEQCGRIRFHPTV